MVRLRLAWAILWGRPVCYRYAFSADNGTILVEPLGMKSITHACIFNGAVGFRFSHAGKHAKSASVTVEKT